MKFPLSTDPFPSFDLSPGKRAEIERFADAMVRETIDEYVAFVSHQQRVVDRRAWKPVKTRENVTVYKQKFKPESGSTQWTMPKLLGVGSIIGTLDDVLYGEMSPDIDSLRIKTSYIGDELVDGRILSQLRYASDDDPFRFLAIKWLVKGHNPAIGFVMRPRDLVLIDAMGVQELPSGERVGFHLMHSVELPQCPELAHLDIVRSKLSACYLFKELSRKKTVEVYLTSLVDAGGHAPDAIAVHTAANSLIQCWKVVWSAQHKKLAWLTNEAARRRELDPDFDLKPARSSSDRDSSSSGGGGTGSGGRARCACCEKTLSGNLRGLMACALCRKTACAKCRIAKQLSYVYGPSKVLVQNTTLFCVDCIVRAKRVSASDIARYEFVPGALAQRNFELLDLGGSARREKQLRLGLAAGGHGGGGGGSNVSSSPLSAVEEERETIVESIEAWEVRQKLELAESVSSASSG